MTSQLAERGAIVEVAPLVVMWPRFPTVTPTGRECHAKNAGRLIPWLSANAISNMARPVYHRVNAMWRTAAERASDFHPAVVWPFEDHRVLILATLYRATAMPLDPFAILEGIKPVVDGLVNAGVLRADDEQHVAGGLARCRKAERRDACRLELRWRVVG